MPYKTRKLKGGKLRVTSKDTGKARTFGSKAKFKRYSRVAEAVKHGWKPTGKRKRK